MSWGTDFTTDIFLSHLTFNNKWEVEELIKEKEMYLSTIKEQVAMFVSSNPKDIIPKEWEDEPIRFLQNQINELFNDYDEEHSILLNLYKYLEVFDEQNKKEDETTIQ